MADLAINQTHIIFVAGGVVKNGKVLVGQRSWEESHAPGKWALPGGKVDQTAGNLEMVLEKTVCREVEEETGLKINFRKVQYMNSNTFIRSTGHHVVAILFKCPYQKGKINTGEEVIKLAWIGPKDIDKYDWAGGTKESVKRLLKAG